MKYGMSLSLPIMLLPPSRMLRRQLEPIKPKPTDIDQKPRLVLYTQVLCVWMLCTQNYVRLEILTDANSIRRSRHDSVGARERLSSSLQRCDIHGRGDTFVVDEVLEEQVEVAREAGDGRGGNKGVNSSIPVRTRVQLECVAPDSSGGDGRPRAGDRASAAIRRKPDHDLVGVRASGRGCKPQVVRDISNDVTPSVAVHTERASQSAIMVPARFRRLFFEKEVNSPPLPNRINGRDGAQLLVHIGHSYVRVRLDGTGPAGPSPGSRPGHGVACKVVEGSALRARGGGRCPPVVMVEGVLSGCLRAI